MCVIPTRNWFIYQKIIRFNAKALRPQIKDKKWWAHWRGPWGERKRRTKKRSRVEIFPPPPPCYSPLLCLHDTRGSSYGNGGAGGRAEWPRQQKKIKTKENNKHVRGIFGCPQAKAHEARDHFAKISPVSPVNIEQNQHLSRESEQRR